MGNRKPTVSLSFISLGSVLLPRAGYEEWCEPPPLIENHLIQSFAVVF